MSDISDLQTEKERWTQTIVHSINTLVNHSEQLVFYCVIKINEKAAALFTALHKVWKQHTRVLASPTFNHYSSHFMRAAEFEQRASGKSKRLVQFSQLA